jgi:hypothetical protein
MTDRATGNAICVFPTAVRDCIFKSRNSTLPGMATTEQKTQRLELLEQMRDSGVQSTTVDGVTTAFRSPAELNTAIIRLKRELGLLPPRKRNRAVYMGHR